LPVVEYDPRLIPIVLVVLVNGDENVYVFSFVLKKVFLEVLLPVF
jgi:hypothetical protein